jgi:DNA transformation protein
MEPGVDAIAAALVEDLAALGDVHGRKMFGGFGIFCDGVMFALVDPVGGCFLRIPDGGDDRYGARHARMPYGQIPDGLRDDGEALAALAAESLAAARAAKT